MSFLSEVKLSNAPAIVEFSVFESTTRKFFCESGGSVICCLWGASQCAESLLELAVAAGSRQLQELDAHACRW